MIIPLRRIWLHDLARSLLRSVEFHGFDISLDQVGHRSWLPANINMHTWDIFADPPPQFVGYFDIVHVRLITVVIRENDPRPVLANLRKLLSTRIPDRPVLTIYLLPLSRLPANTDSLGA